MAETVVDTLWLGRVLHENDVMREALQEIADMHLNNRTQAIARKALADSKHDGQETSDG